MIPYRLDYQIGAENIGIFSVVVRFIGLNFPLLLKKYPKDTAIMSGYTVHVLSQSFFDLAIVSLN